VICSLVLLQLWLQLWFTSRISLAPPFAPPFTLHKVLSTLLFSLVAMNGDDTHRIEVKGIDAVNKRLHILSIRLSNACPPGLRYIIISVPF
jgi:hypothetical protein